MGGSPLIYGRRAHDFEVPGFVAWGDPAAPARLGLDKYQGESLS